MSENPSFASLHNGECLPLAQVPELPMTAFRRAVMDAVEAGWRVSSLFAADAGPEVALYAVMADDTEGLLHVARTRHGGESFPAMTPECPAVHLFEREIAEQFRLVPEGHPWLKPVRFAPPLLPGPGVLGDPAIGVTDFFRVRGQEVHEVAVGPVHAGVIEPGHFRFQCHGEHVFHLEISLGYQHRGVEEAMAGGPHRRSLFQMETACGDTTVGHAWAYCQNLEALGQVNVPARGQALRGIALELERLANHTGDLGALAGDVGFLPTASYCGRIRGDFLNMSAVLCGSRFSRGLVRPGGTGFDVEEARIKALREQLARAKKDVTVAVELLWDTPSVLARFENIGAVSIGACEDIGMVGLAARACGVDRDVRRDHPTGIFRVSQIPVTTAPGGDVYARAHVRWLEIQRSLHFLHDQLVALPQGPVRAPAEEIARPLQAESLAVSLIEGWRGEICHVALTDAAGRFARYKITDPSFHNWFGLALCLRGQEISDFPLCNKSFNLSYCGHDL